MYVLILPFGLLRATSPPSFALEVFVQCEGETRFRRLCQPFLYSHSSSNVLEVEVSSKICVILVLFILWSWKMVSFQDIVRRANPHCLQPLCHCACMGESSFLFHFFSSGVIIVCMTTPFRNSLLCLNKSIRTFIFCGH